ncbi:GMC family oxidoreductase N-terminal domain-containing protein [Ensifer sp. SSB1]|uniref:GMC family oxidoreductase n=1 Tax=Ensifer sp. SSB1 TaxID=2795385 RepID=UPI001A476FE7|nr:GMC family oxidoreductase N-terminal domain-containing protein [Ensifer sp. SSB1]MBK5567092.1 GMC family oxidoreductase N-terminal domain-containing protein [Ensifer sp. SSB1]
MTNDTNCVDFIVVGSGSTGSVVAGRLSEDGKNRVLLLEAGGSDRTLNVLMPGLGYTTLYNNPRYDWRFVSEPDPTRGGRTDFMPRGKVLGGTSSINSMSFLRGSPEDYDTWAAMGNTGWDYVSLLKYFKRSENFNGPKSDVRGASGPQPVSTLRSPHSLAKAFISSSVNAGLNYLPDVNGGQYEGVGYAQATESRGWRYSAARSYVWPAKRRSNFKLVLKATVETIIFEGKRAVGVRYVHDGRLIEVRANRAVIVSGGTFGSPQILMLSGIGPAGHLQEMGIEVRGNVPGVGHNFQDHAGTSHTALTKTRTYNVMQSPIEKAWIALRWLLKGDGPASTPVAHVVGAHSFDQPDRISRLQVMFCPGGFEMGDSGPQFMDRPAVSGLTNVHRPYSTGWVSLRSTNPRDTLRIQPNLLSDERDIQTLVDGHKLMRQIFATAPLADDVISEVEPGEMIRSDAELTAYVKANAAGVYHPSSTCKMGIDDMSVVGPDLKVRGFEGLYVADASIMPFVVSANLSATCIMIGEKLADELLH